MRLLSPLRLLAREPDATKKMLPRSVSDAAVEVIPALAATLTVASAIHPVAQAALKQWKSRPATASDEDVSSPELTFLSTIGWIGAGVGTVALGLVLGRELRRRYKFHRRTPYDFYAHSGDERDLEFGVGI